MVLDAIEDYYLVAELLEELSTSFARRATAGE
jgi:hypothetical protein